MGLDMLDITFRIERALGITLSDHHYKPDHSRPDATDITVGEVFDVIVSKGRPIGCPKCIACGYSLRGHAPLSEGSCPECGMAFNTSRMTFDEFRHILVTVLGKHAATASRDTLFVRDLRMDK